MLAGLGSEYEPLVTSITTKDEAVTLGSFYTHFLSAELRLEQQNAASDIHPSSANSVTRGHDSNRGGRGGQGGGQNRGQQQSRNRGNGKGRSNLKCQVCSKFGHDALRLRLSTRRWQMEQLKQYGYSPS